MDFQPVDTQVTISGTDSSCFNLVTVPDQEHEISENLLIECHLVHEIARVTIEVPSFEVMILDSQSKPQTSC